MEAYFFGEGADHARRVHAAALTGAGALCEQRSRCWGGAHWLEASRSDSALACVMCNVYEIHWAGHCRSFHRALWLAVLTSGCMAMWRFRSTRAVPRCGAGWRLFGRRRRDAPVRPRAPRRYGGPGLSAPGALRLLALWLAGGCVLGAILARYTDTDAALLQWLSDSAASSARS